MLSLLPAITGNAPILVSLSTNMVRGSGTVFPIISNPVTVTASGGSRQYTYSWVRVSGFAEIFAVDPAQATTRFQANGNIPSGESRLADFRVTVTDSEGFSADSSIVSVELNNGVEVVLSVSLLPNVLSEQGEASVQTTETSQVVASGGTPPYTYLWQRLSGSQSIIIDQPTDAFTTFTADIPVSVVQAQFNCRVTDSLGSIAFTGAVDVTIERTAAPPALVASVNPPAVTAESDVVPIITQQSIATAIGGRPPFTYLWERIGGSSLITADDPMGDRTAFRATPPADGMPYQSTFSCTITDDAGQMASDTVDVTITREATPT